MSVMFRARRLSLSDREDRFGEPLGSLGTHGKVRERQTMVHSRSIGAQRMVTKEGNPLAGGDRRIRAEGGWIPEGCRCFQRTKKTVSTH